MGTRLLCILPNVVALPSAYCSACMRYSLYAFPVFALRAIGRSKAAREWEPLGGGGDIICPLGASVGVGVGVD